MEFDIASILPFVLGAVVLIIAIGLISVGVTRRNETDPLADKLEQYGSQAEVKMNLEDIEMSVPFTQRVLLPIMQQIAKITEGFAPQQMMEKTQHLIDIAGNPNGLTPTIVWAMRFVALLLMSGIMAMLMSSRGGVYLVGGIIGGAVFGYMMPQMYLMSKAKRRQDDILKALPDALDLMSIAVEAGLGFDQAMGKVYEKWDNELGLAFGQVLREIQLGSLRREALRRMADGMEVNEVTSFVAAIIQADQLGVSISRVLKIQAEQMRIKRRQRAQEKAQQAPIKMMIPMVIFIFPSIWLVILGPSGVQLFKAFF